MTRVYACDLDRTLLRDDATLSDFSRRSLGELIENGLRFIVASARNMAAIREILDGLPLRLPVIELNGAAITDFHTGEHLVIHDLDKDLLPELHALAARRGFPPLLVTFDGAGDRIYHGKTGNEETEWYLEGRRAAGDAQLREIEDLTQAFRDRALSMAVAGRGDPLKELADEVVKTFAGRVEIHLFENPYHRGWWWLSIHDRRATKGQALAELLERLGFDPADLTVFGDDSNDVGMFEFAARAVAVENALPCVLELATEVIGPNDADSVARYILQDVAAEREGHGVAAAGGNRRAEAAAHGEVVSTPAAPAPVPSSPAASAPARKGRGP